MFTFRENQRREGEAKPNKFIFWAANEGVRRTVVNIHRQRTACLAIIFLASLFTIVCDVFWNAFLIVFFFLSSFVTHETNLLSLV